MNESDQPSREMPNEGDQIRAKLDEVVQPFLVTLNELSKSGYTINFNIKPSSPGGRLVMTDVQVLKAI